MVRRSRLTFKPQPLIGKGPKLPDRIGGSGAPWPAGASGPKPKVKPFVGLADALRQKGK
jgi:hypothetical protein